MDDRSFSPRTASEPLSLDEEYAMQKSWTEDGDKCTFIILQRSLLEEGKEEIEAMIGDVNLFFNNHDDPHEAEAEIMIAEASARGKGYGRQALLLMLQYGVDNQNVKKYTVKIGEGNEASIKLFTSIGFEEVSRSSVFKEITFEMPWEKLVEDARHYIDTYNSSIESYKREDE
eukprot:m.47926 g.47926  ORF g.47926 m.47926 type:complete len:173 (+) comp7367_c0_seq1:191-709(+)